MGFRALNKLRSISKNDVNIGRMAERLQRLDGAKANAFYSVDPRYKKVTDDLMASKVKGRLGTIAVGDDAKALPIVAHELGHATNQRTGRAKWRILGGLLGGGIGFGSLLASKAILFNGASKLLKDDIKNAVLLGVSLGGVGASVGGALANHAVYTEEKEASERAVEYLKKFRRTPEQLAQDKEVLDKGLNTYKSSRDWDFLGTLGLSAASLGGLYLASKYI